ncbi:hypothetical protein Rhe02_19100 [Rhizocola hellebori]|uniref:Uncharacterized protein n=1 Tax=Rhizocola hellebori TaxID=1392758 RepID=A0A8J3Q4K8_9ACTN|nr:hypothetical protein [Rhizocola hellebori]GIH03843.1 hypothetical protein Rhe02_19100 [Rhizocola hellebori]
MGEPIASDWLSFPPSQRFALEPDPAWDWSETDAEGALVVELSWLPDALAGRLDELVASPDLARALTEAGVTGFTIATARGLLHENFFEAPGTPSPQLQRLVVGDELHADLSYQRKTGLIASPRAVAVLAAHCRQLTISPLREGGK